MTEHRNIFVALAAAQGEFGAVVKDAINPAFKGEGKPKGTAYADLASVIAAVGPALSKHGISRHAEVRADGREMATVLVHGASETRIECVVPLIVSKNDMQGFKSATTYAKRIGLESVTGVAPDDDDGNAAAAAAPPKAAEPPPPEAPPKKTLADWITETRLSIGGAPSADELRRWWANIAKARNAADAKDPEAYAVLAQDYEAKLAALEAAQPNPFSAADAPF